MREDVFTGYKRLAKRKARGEGMAIMAGGFVLACSGLAGVGFLITGDIIAPKLMLVCAILAIGGVLTFLGGAGRIALTYLV